ncbi:hypothetical protein BGX27_004139, partial [Mortierella sp. AM989]
QPVNIAVKKDLLEKFETWKSDHAQQFWLDLQTRSSQLRTAGVLVEGPEPFAHQSIRRNASQIHSDLTTSENESSSSRNDITDGNITTPYEISDLVDSENSDRLAPDSTVLDTSKAAAVTMASTSNQTSSIADSILGPASVDAEPEQVDISIIDKNERSELLASIDQASHAA